MSVISSVDLAGAATEVLAFSRGTLAGCETVLFSLARAVYSRDKLKTELDISSSTRSAFAPSFKAAENTENPRIPRIKNDQTANRVVTFLEKHKKS
jgi:hypothetical protein